MKRSSCVTIVALVATTAPAWAQSVWVAPAAQKVRPGDRAGTAASISLEAAGNEFEAFHVVVAGGSAGAANVTVSADPLTDGAGHQISDARVFREAWYTVVTPSNSEGAPGRWPDAMIPAVDEVDGQPRNAFPYSVPANEQQPTWVEYHVPAGAPAGWYSGTVHVTGGVTADVPVRLYVHAFSLPSTASIRTAFGIGWADPCTAHYGGYAQCGGDAGTQAILGKYARFMLDHRLSLSEAIYTGPLAKSDGSYDWASWDAAWAAMLDGNLGGRLAGAKLTSVRYQWTVDQVHYAEWAKHFTQHGWLDRTFDYTCDEPPAGCQWSQIAPRAAMVHAAEPKMTTLVTTTMANATANNVLGGIDTLVATLPFLEPMPPLTATRDSYDAWLAQSAQHQVWVYQSCDSDGCNGTGDATQSTWPSYMIDVPATQNRAMEWQAWRQKVSGELYYDTTYAFTRGDAWTNQFYFGGNGDGTLLYPGTPAKIGGTSQVPIASLRLKMMRDGQEDYEYLKMVADAGDPAMADSEAAGLAPKPYQLATDPEAVDAARHRMALRIEALTQASPPPMGGGSMGAGGTAGTGTVAGSDTTYPTSGLGTGGNATAAADATHGTSAGGCAMGGRRPVGGSMLIALAALLMARGRRRRGPGGSA